MEIVEPSQTFIVIVTVVQASWLVPFGIQISIQKIKRGLFIWVLVVKRFGVNNNSFVELHVDTSALLSDGNYLGSLTFRGSLELYNP
jgi:hypothetical protein